MNNQDKERPVGKCSYCPASGCRWLNPENPQEKAVLGKIQRKSVEACDYHGTIADGREVPYACFLADCVIEAEYEKDVQIVLERKGPVRSVISA